MRPVSSKFASTVRSSHAMCARARVVTGHQTGTNPTGTEIPIMDGEVTLDANSEIRGTVDLTTSGVGTWPASTSDLLTPYGNELFIERGIVYSTGQREWISQGYYRITSVEQQDAPNGPIRITGQDRMAGIIDARLETPIQFPIGTSVEDVFTELVEQVYPNATILYESAAVANQTFPTAHIVEESRYEFLHDIARSLGLVLYWDHEGQLLLVAAPDPTDPVVTVNHGRDGVLVSMSRALDRTGVFNAVVASGEQPSNAVAPVRAVARDMSPTSATYYLGAFGKVPRFYSSPLITTPAQARSAAAAMLTRSLGLPYQVDFRQVPNPALEPLDPVRVTYADHQPGRTHVIERITIPLVASGTQTATTREQTNVLVEVT